MKDPGPIERLGALREGVLGNHMAAKEGRRRDTVMFAITERDWPAVKARLESFLDETR